MSNKIKFYFKGIKNLDKKRIKELIGEKKGTTGGILYNLSKSKKQLEFKIKENEISISFYEVYDKETAKEIIEFLTKLHKVSGSGGFGLGGYDGEEEFSKNPKKELEKISRIWSVNLFTPEEVKKYGRKKVLSAPCEIIEELEDGAIIVVVHKDSFSSTFEEREKLRKHLNEK